MPVLLFGDHIAAYGTIRGLAIEGIPIYLVSRKGNGLSTHSRFVKKTFVLEPVEDGFIEGLNSLAEEIGGRAVVMVAGDDVYLDLLSKNMSRLPGGFKCTFHGWDVVSMVRQKHITYQKCAEIGVGFPMTYYVGSAGELEDVLAKLDIDFPVLLKAEDSRRFVQEFQTKGIIAYNKLEVLKIYDECKGFFGGLLLSEHVPGGEDLLFCLKTVLNRDAEPLAVFVDKKIRSSQQFSACSLTVSTWSTEVVEHGLQLLCKIGYYGYASVEFKFDERCKVYKLMEINGRISMNNSHALKCGINLALIMYNEAVGASLEPLKELKQTYPNNVLWWYPEADLSAMRNMIVNKTFKLSSFIAGLAGRRYIIEPFNWRDPYPAITTIRKILRGIVKVLISLVWKK
jgi:predicted ATP-grasp superfamily ATP-dependent carboligase